MATGTRSTGKQPDQAGNQQGKALLVAVERIVESPEQILARVSEVEVSVRASLPGEVSDEQVRQALEQRLIRDYSNRTALAGGAAALPAMFPGIGTLAAIVGGGLVDMTMCLKYEVEMVLALASVRGYDIEDPRERQLAYMLAAAHTCEVSSGQNALADLLKTEIDAVWNFTPRQLGKLVAALFVKLALWYTGKGALRALPVVGVLVSSGANKTLTVRVGRSVLKSLDQRAIVTAAPEPSARRAGARKSAARSAGAQKPAARPAAKTAGARKSTGKSAGAAPKARRTSGTNR